MSEPSEAVIEFVGVRKRFGTQEAVRELNLRIPRGCVYALLGPNGAGKSTTIKMAMGSLRRDEGSIRILGREVCDDPSWVKQRVGFVGELQFIYRWMRIGEVIRFCSSFYPTWNATLCQELLKRFELDPRKKVRHLSKGMTVKLGLLLAIAHEPEVLILDEPTSGLDPLMREDFVDGILRNMCDGRRSILFASHTLQDVSRLADRVGILVDGELLVDRPIDELLQTTKTIRAVLTDEKSPRRTPHGAIVESVDRREWSVTVSDFSAEQVEQVRSQNRVESIDAVNMNLEEIFKAYVRGRRNVA